MSLLSEYRPRSATEILDASFQLYRAHAPALLVIAAIVFVPPAVLAGIAPAGAGRLIELAGNLLIPVAQGATAVLVAAAFEGRSIDAGEAFGALRGRIGTLMVLQVAAGILMMLGLILLIVPGILVIIWTAVSQPVAAIEGAPMNEALKRSRELARGHAMHVLGTLALMIVLLFALLIGGGLVVGIAAGIVGLGDAAIDFVAGMLIVPLYPLLAVATSLLYFDLRVRREGADLEAMAAALPPDAAQAARSA